MDDYSDVYQSFAGGNTLTFAKELQLTDEESGEIPGVPVISYEYRIKDQSMEDMAIQAKHSAGLLQVRSGIPAALVQNVCTITFDGTDSPDPYGMVTDYGSFVFNPACFPEPGVYRYKVTEKAAVSKQYRANIQGTQKTDHYVDVYVQSAEDGSMQIAGYVFLEDNAEVGADPGQTQKTTGYTGMGGKSVYSTHDLVITSKVTGNAASRNDLFQYDVLVASGSAESSYAGLNIGYQVDGDEVNYQTIGQDGTLQLPPVSMRSGSELRILGLPAEVTYQVVQENAPSGAYTVSATSDGIPVNFGDAITPLSSVTGNAAVAPGCFTGQMVHSVDYQNMRVMGTPTGVSQNVGLGFLAAAIALAVLLARRHMW